MPLNVDPNDLKLLTEVGFSAVTHGLGDDVGAIFRMLETWQPGHASGAVGLAMIALSHGDRDAAERMLAAVIDRAVSGREDAMAVLAMCKLANHRPHEAREICEQLIGTGGAAETLAKSLMDEGQFEHCAASGGAMR